MKKIIILNIFAVILLAFMCSTSLAFTDSTTFADYQFSENNEAFIDETTRVGSYANDDATLMCSMSDGMDYQTLTGNFDGDTDKEFIIISASAVKIYDNDCSVNEELSTGLTLLSQPSLYNETTIAFIGRNTSGNEFAFLYGINPLTKIAQNEIINQNAFTGVTCLEDIYCYALASNTTQTTAIKWNASGNTQYSHTNVDVIQSNYGSPALDRFVSSTRDSLVTSCDANNNGQWGFCVFNADDLTLDTFFSTDGIFDDITYDSGLILNQKWINQPMLSSVTGGNNKLVTSYTTCKDEAGDDYISHLFMFNNDGSEYQSTDITMSDNLGGTCAGTAANKFINWGTSPVVKHLNDATTVYCIRWGYSTLGGFTCVDKNDATILQRSSGTWSDMVLNPISTHIPLFSVSMLNDTSDRDLVTSFNILDNDLNETGFRLDATPLNPSKIANGSIIFEDFDNDGSLDILFSDSSGTRLISSAIFTNAVPNIYNNLSRGGYGSNLGFDSPICLNNTITFTAQECGGTVTSCNYDNDVATDKELISTNCGQEADGSVSVSHTTNKVDGTLSTAQPSYSCFYNKTGTFNVRLYLEDDKNAGDLTQYNTEVIVVNVIDGVPGLTCNIGVPAGVGSEVDEGTDPTGIDDSIDSTLGIFFGTSQKLKLIVSMGLFIGIMASVASQTKNGFVLASSGLATLIMLTFLGLIPAYIMILLMVGMIMLIIVGRFMLSDNSSS